MFGTLVPQSGDLSNIVESLQTPIDIAVEEINEAGGVLGKPVTVIEGDDGTSPTVAQTTYNKLVNTDKVDAIIGPAPSSVAAQARRVARHRPGPDLLRLDHGGQPDRRG